MEPFSYNQQTSILPTTGRHSIEFTGLNSLFYNLEARVRVKAARMLPDGLSSGWRTVSLWANPTFLNFDKSTLT